MEPLDLDSLVDESSESYEGPYVPRLQRGSPSAERLSFVNDKPTDPMPQIYADEAVIPPKSASQEEIDALSAQMDAFNEADVTTNPALMPSAEQEGDVMSENLPPLFSFGDQALFNEQLELRGLEGVTRDIVEFASNKLPDQDITYEGLRDGSANILDYLNPEMFERPTEERAMSNEGILAMLTDLEDFGKYDPAVAQLNPDGTPMLDPDTGEPMYEEKRYNLSAFASGFERNAVNGGATLLGGWIGARSATQAYSYMSRVPRTGIPQLRPLEVGAKTAAAVVGAIVGSGLANEGAEYVNQWMFEEPDPVVLPSMQSAYNAGETSAYGISFLATPWIGTRLVGAPLAANFNASKILGDLKTIASGKFSPEALQRMFSRELLDKAADLAKQQASKGKVKGILTPNLTKGPTAARITDSLVQGSAKALENGLKNPAGFLGFESSLVLGMAGGAYLAEEVFPGNPAARLVGEIVSVPPSLLAVKAITYGYGKLNAATTLLKEGMEDGSLLVKDALGSEGSTRLFEDLIESPEYKALENPQEELNLLIDTLINSQGNPDFRGPRDPAKIGLSPSEILRDVDSPLASAVERQEAQVATRVSDLAVATDQGKDRYIANAKQAIMKLRETNNPEAIQIAAAIEQKVVEQEIIDTLASANQKLVDASSTVFGNTEVIPQDAKLSASFYELQLKIVAALKQKRDKMWARVPDFDITTFVDDAGNELEQPNLVTVFETPTMNGGLKFTSEGGQDTFERILGSYKKDIDAIVAYFNPEAAVEAAMPDFKSLKTKLAKALEKIELGDDEKVPDLVSSLLENALVREGGSATTFNELPAIERVNIIQRLRDEANEAVQQTEVWGDGPRPDFKIPLGGAKLAKAFNAQATLFDAQHTAVIEMEGAASAATKAAEEAEYPVTYSRLREMLSNFKSVRADRLRANPMDNMASSLGVLIKTLSQDMTGLSANQIFKDAGENLDNQQVQIIKDYMAANAYTAGMHNVISRTFVSEASKVTAARGMALDPSQAVEAAKVGDDIPLMRIQQMQRAADFLNKNTSDITSLTYRNPSTGVYSEGVDFNAEQTGLELNQMIESIVRDARKNIMVTKIDPLTGVAQIDPLTGKKMQVVHPKRLDAYMSRRDSEGLWAIFPQFKRDLKDLETAQATLNAYEANAKALKASPEQKAFKWFLQRPESASSVIADIVANNKDLPARETLQNIVDKIKLKKTYTNTETGEEYSSDVILDGLRAAISNYAVVKSGGSGNGFSPTIYYDTLFSDLKKVDAFGVSGGFKLMDFMKKNGMVDDQYVENLQTALGQMRNVEEAVANNEVSGKLFKKFSIAKIGTYKIVGALLVGSALQRFKKVLGAVGLGDVGIGGGVVAGGVGAELGPRMFLTGPETLVVNRMSQILQDPKLLSLAIKEVSTVSELNKNLSIMAELMGNVGARQVPKINRDINSDKSVLAPDEEPDYSNVKSFGKPLSMPTADPQSSVPVPVRLPPVERMQLPSQQMQQAPRPVAPQPLQQAPQVAASGPVDRERFAALFPEDRDLMSGIGSLGGVA